jgi:hypothetical protein
VSEEYDKIYTIINNSIENTRYSLTKELVEKFNEYPNSIIEEIIKRIEVSYPIEEVIITSEVNEITQGYLINKLLEALKYSRNKLIVKGSSGFNDISMTTKDDINTFLAIIKNRTHLELRLDDINPYENNGECYKHFLDYDELPVNYVYYDADDLVVWNTYRLARDIVNREAIRDTINKICSMKKIGNMCGSCCTEPCEYASLLPECKWDKYHDSYDQEESYHYKYKAPLYEIYYLSLNSIRLFSGLRNQSLTIIKEIQFFISLMCLPYYNTKCDYGSINNICNEYILFTIKNRKYCNYESVRKFVDDIFEFLTEENRAVKAYISIKLKSLVDKLSMVDERNKYSILNDIAMFNNLTKAPTYLLEGIKFNLLFLKVALCCDSDDIEVKYSIIKETAVDYYNSSWKYSEESIDAVCKYCESILKFSKEYLSNETVIYLREELEKVTYQLDRLTDTTGLAYLNAVNKIDRN